MEILYELAHKIPRTNRAAYGRRIVTGLKLAEEAAVTINVATVHRESVVAEDEAPST